MSFINYIKETKAEMKHVSWPTRKQSINYTLLVIVISLATALLLGFFDFIFTMGLEKIIQSKPPTYIPSEDTSSTTPANSNSTTSEKFNLSL